MIVANLAQSPADGAWRALDGRAILATYRRAAGALYQAQLRYELTRTLGVEWARPVTGLAEIAGVPEPVLRAFSRRRSQVVEHLEANQTSGFYASRVAALSTREPKEHLDLEQLREEWRSRAAECGLGRRELARLVHRAPQRRPPSAQELRRSARTLLGVSGLTSRESSFAEPEVVFALSEALDGAPAMRVRDLARELLALDGVARLSEDEPGRPGRHSTTELLRCEREALRLVERGRRALAPAVSATALEQLLATERRTRPLSAEQEAMVRAVARSTDRVACVVGRAGAGKTMATRALAAALREAGFPVLGAAPSGIAAQRLRADSGVPSQTLHRLLAEAERRGGLPAGCALIVDEASMAETRLLARALGEVKRAGGRAVLIGDPGQLPAVGAGGLFAAIAERAGALELTGNRRQRDARERDALAALRDGRAGDYLAFASERGRLVVSGEPHEARARLLADWWAAASEDLAGSVMLAHGRRDVAALNAGARALMREAGRLGDARVMVAGRPLAAGERIVCLRNDEALGVRNGTLGTVEDVDRERRVLVLRTDAGERLTLTRSYLDAGHASHAYALTGHKSQGLSLERTFVLGLGAGRLREWGYVALSRARTETRLYVTGAELEAEAHPLMSPVDDPLARFTAALERSGAHAWRSTSARQRAPRERRVRGPRPVRSSPRGQSSGSERASQRLGQRSRPCPSERSSSMSWRSSPRCASSVSRPSAASIRARSPSEATAGRRPLPIGSRLAPRRRSS